MKHEQPDGAWCYEGQVPAFVEAELDRLYGGRYASMAHLAAHGHLAGASTFVARRGGQVVTVLVFARHGGVLRVLIEGMALTGSDLALFAEHMFRTDGAVRVIRFEAVEAAAPRLPFPSQCLPCALDTTMPIPASAEAWLAVLGATTRYNLKRHARLVRQAEPSFTFEVFERQQVDPDDVRAIVGLNRLRMAAKNKVGAIGQAEEDQIIAYCRERGLVGVARIGGQLCGGVILYRLGRNFSLRILAHAPVHDRLHIGTVCLYLTICAAIAAGEGSARGMFYFGWGDEQYKARLGARPRQLSRLLIYRSRLDLLRHARLAAGAQCAAAWFLARQALRRARRRARTAMGRLAASVRQARKARQ